MARKLFEDHLEKKHKPQDKDMRIEIAQDFERLKKDSKAYFFLMKRVSDLKDEAHMHVMMLAGEPIGGFWRAKVEAFDAILGIPDEFFRKAVEATEDNELRSIV